MNGVHDMGAWTVGKVEPEPNEPMFHAEWEARVMAMVRAMARPARSTSIRPLLSRGLAAARLLSSSYYKKWFLALRTC